MSAWLNRRISWANDHRGILLFFVGAAFSCALIVLAAAEIVTDTRQAEDPERVAREWEKTLESLGLHAAFPLTEDIHVGDLFATDQGAPGDLEPRPMFSSIIITHITETKTVLEAVYRDVPRFPVTPKGYDGSTPIEADGPIFMPPSEIRGLSIAAFPEVLVSTAVGGTSGGFFPRVRALFGTRRTSSESVRIRISQAETYGIPAQAANDLLDHFCLPPPDRTEEWNVACTQRRARLLLSSLVGPNVLCDGERPKKHKVESPQHEISLALITKVYLARTIEYVYGSDTSVVAAVRTALDRSAPHQPQTLDASGRDVASSQQTPEARLAAAQDRLRQELDYIGGGGTLSFGGITSNGVVFTQQFMRPVVIGYAALFESPTDPDKCVSTSSPQP